MSVQLLFPQETMASFISKLETWLKCHICQGTVREPKTLQCFHSFCEDCLRQVTNKTPRGVEGVKCPVCNAFTSKNQIRTNSLVCELIEMHKGKFLNVYKFRLFTCVKEHSTAVINVKSKDKNKTSNILI